MSKIVLVDDEEDLLELVKGYLEGEGHTVFTAAEGKKGLELILSEKPELAILDIRLPGLSGFEIMSQARAAQPGLKVLMLTGYQDEEADQKAVAAGALQVLKKPIGLQEIDSAISASLG